MNNHEEDVNLHLRPRSTETVYLEIPQDTLKSLPEVA